MAVEAFTGAACALELLLPNNICCTYSMRVVEEEEGMRVDEDEECRLAEPSLDNCSLHG